MLTIRLLAAEKMAGLPAVLLQSCLTLSYLWTVTCLAFVSMGLSRQEYWSVLS